MPVEIRNAQRQVPLDTRRLKRVAQRLLAALDRSEAVLSILLTDDRRMAGIHERWMGEPGPTDVLSFPMGGETLGDIAISLETASRRCSGDLFAEVTRVLIHGLLHLVGHDHAGEKERQRMNREARRLWRAAKERG